MNLYPVLSQLYKEGSYQGQCFAFMHKLVRQDEKFPGLPALYGGKYKELLRSGIPINKLDTLKIGDVLLLNYGINGHGAMINNIIGDQLQLTESNYYEFTKPLRVTHTRKIAFHDKAIMGVWRGTALYPVPSINYPINLKVSILMNTQKHWTSLVEHLHNLESWFMEASGGKIQLTTIPVYTNVHGWETVATGPVLGGANVEIIKESWFDQFIMPLALPNSHITIFNMDKQDWKGTVFSDPNAIELGFAYESVNMNFPAKIMCVWDEMDDYPPYYPSPLSAAAKLWAHEICHLLYGLAGGPNIVPGGDYTHRRWFAENNPQAVFGDIDYEKLNSKII